MLALLASINIDDQAETIGNQLEESIPQIATTVVLALGLLVLLGWKRGIDYIRRAAIIVFLLGAVSAGALLWIYGMGQGMFSG